MTQSADNFLLDPPRDLHGHFRTIRTRIGNLSGLSIHNARCATLSFLRVIFGCPVFRHPDGEDQTEKERRALQGAFFLLYSCLTIYPQFGCSGSQEWWKGQDGRRRLQDLAASHAGSAVSVEDALEVLRQAKWEWTSPNSLNNMAAQLQGMCKNKIQPMDLCSLVMAAVSAAELLVVACWPRGAGRGGSGTSS